jgi:hypothetical protein
VLVTIGRSPDTDSLPKPSLQPEPSGQLGRPQPLERCGGLRARSFLTSLGTRPRISTSEESTASTRTAVTISFDVRHRQRLRCSTKLPAIGRVSLGLKTFGHLTDLCCRFGRGDQRIYC